LVAGVAENGEGGVLLAVTAALALGRAEIISAPRSCGRGVRVVTPLPRVNPPTVRMGTLVVAGWVMTRICSIRYIQPASVTTVPLKRRSR